MKRIIGVDVGGTKIASVLAEYGDDFRILGRLRIDTGAERGCTDVIEDICGTIDNLLTDGGLSAGELSGIGIALPGPVDSKSGISFDCPNLKGWKNIEIRKILQQRYGTFIYAENDARAAAAGEAAFGAGRDISDFVYISISTGIGCGIIIDGRVYKGAHGAAGELSHIIFPGGGELYKLASGKAVEELFSVSAENMKTLYENGESSAVKAFEHLLEYLGTGISNVVTLLNPAAVVIGGGLGNLGDFLLKPLECEIRRKAFSVSGEKVQILKAENINDAGVLGICSMLLSELPDSDTAAF